MMNRIMSLVAGLFDDNANITTGGQLMMTAQALDNTSDNIFFINTDRVFDENTHATINYAVNTIVRKGTCKYDDHFDAELFVYDTHFVLEFNSSMRDNLERIAPVVIAGQISDLRVKDGYVLVNQLKSFEAATGWEILDNGELPTTVKRAVAAI